MKGLPKPMVYYTKLISYFFRMNKFIINHSGLWYLSVFRSWTRLVSAASSSSSGGQLSQEAKTVCVWYCCFLSTEKSPDLWSTLEVYQSLEPLLLCYCCVQTNLVSYLYSKLCSLPETRMVASFYTWGLFHRPCGCGGSHCTIIPILTSLEHQQSIIEG